MPEPTEAITPRHLTDANVDVLTSFYPVPGLGIVPINAYLLRSKQPVLLDTGAIVLRERYLAALSALIDLDDLRWIVLTHADPDHIGGLHAVLDAAPRAKLVTTYLGLGKLGLIEAPAPERVHLLNPGQRLDVGDRELLALRPPVFDAPETTAFFDTKTGALFSSDCFGAVLSEPAEHAADLAERALHDGMVLWATLDAPWLAGIDAQYFEGTLRTVRDLGPKVVLGSHLPPAFGMTATLLANLASARGAPPFVGPDQAAFTAMLTAALGAGPSDGRRDDGRRDDALERRGPSAITAPR